MSTIIAPDMPVHPTSGDPVSAVVGPALLAALRGHTAPLEQQGLQAATVAELYRAAEAVLEVPATVPANVAALARTLGAEPCEWTRGGELAHQWCQPLAPPPGPGLEGAVAAARPCWQREISW